MGWYVERDGQKHGPISSGELKRLADTREINARTRVLKEGTQSWAGAGRINGLFAADPYKPPALPQSAAPIIVAQSQPLTTSVVCPHCQGNFLVALPNAPIGDGRSSGKTHVLTEQTAKRYKLVMLGGAAASVAGTVIAGRALASGSQASGQVSLGAVLLVGGLIAFISGRMLAWWFHG